MTSGEVVSASSKTIRSPPVRSASVFRKTAIGEPSSVAACASRARSRVRASSRADAAARCCGLSSRSSTPAQRAQRLPGVGGQAQVHGVVLGDLVGVEVDVDDLRARPEGALQLGEHLREDIGADDQHPVGVPDQLLAVRAEHVARLAAPQRVRGRDVHLGRVDLVHVGAQQLGDGGEFVLRPGERDPVPDEDHRPLRGGEQLGRPPHRGRMRAPRP